MIPSPAIVAAVLTPHVELYLMARAQAEVLLETVDTLATEILAATAYLDAKGERITTPSRSFLICASQAPGYFQALEDATNEAIPNDLEPGYCPALVADSARVAAEQELLRAMGPLFGFDADRVYSLEHRKGLIENGVGLTLAAQRLAA